MPGIQIAYFDSFSDLSNKDFWNNQLHTLPSRIVLDPKYRYENKLIGGGCVPIETKDGWLLIYHAVESAKFGNVYHASVALLDKNNPQKVIARLQEPLFSPDEVWEKKGHVANVVFPSTALAEGNNLVIFYGAADTKIAVKIVDLESLLLELKKFRINN